MTNNSSSQQRMNSSSQQRSNNSGYDAHGQCEQQQQPVRLQRLRLPLLS